MSNETNEVVSNVEIFGEVLLVQQRQRETTELFMMMRKEILKLTKIVEDLSQKVATIDHRTAEVREMMITIDPSLGDAYELDTCNLPEPSMKINLQVLE